MKRRKLGGILSSPIMNLAESDKYGSLIFVEKNHMAALNTRAAALMFIGRHHLDLTTKVVDEKIFVMKDKDYPGRSFEVNLAVY